MGRSTGASFEVVTGNLVEETNGVPFEFFNGVNLHEYKTLISIDKNKKKNKKKIKLLLKN